MQNYTAEYELSMKYQYAVHTGDTGCVVSTAWAELQGLENENQQTTYWYHSPKTELELEPEPKTGTWNQKLEPLQWERKGKI